MTESLFAWKKIIKSHNDQSYTLSKSVCCLGVAGNISSVQGLKPHAESGSIATMSQFAYQHQHLYHIQRITVKGETLQKTHKKNVNLYFHFKMICVFTLLDHILYELCFCPALCLYLGVYIRP